MEGPKWAAADWAVKQLLADLDDRERFALGVFHNTTTWFDKAPSTATMDVVQRAYRFLDSRRDSGGTELGVALEQALGRGRPSGEHARHVIVITDAQVSDDGRITRLAEQEARQSDRRRISMLCIDAAPNSFLALDLAERGGGVARFLTSAPEEEDIATALDDVLATWARPVAAGMRLEVNRRHVEVTSGDALAAADGQRCAVALGDLPSGRSVWVAGRAPRGDTADLRFGLASSVSRQSGGRESTADPIELVPGTLDMPALKALFGARRVLALEHLMHAGYSHDDLARHLADLGYNPDEVLSGASAAGARVYAENTQRDQAQALRALLVREALEFGLASAETAFVATRKEPGKPVEQTMVVANALPAGWSEGFVAGPMVAAPVAMRMAAAPVSASIPPSSPASFGGIRRRLARFAERATLREEALDLYADASTAAPMLRAKGSATVPERRLVVFPAAPRFEGSQAVLFDSRTDASTALPDQAVLSSLRVRFLDGAPDPASLDPDLRILVFVEDLASPRAQVRLVDLLRQQGERPLNLRKGPGQPVRIVLADPHGAWAARAPQLEVSLGW
jgi:Ca-activated chloride channel family protein